MKQHTTEQLYNNLLTLKRILHLIENGLFPGMAHTDITEAMDYLIRLHSAYLDEFKKRPDRTDYDKSIDAIPGIQGVE